MVEAVLDDDVGVGHFAGELDGEGLCGQLMTSPDGGRHDEDARTHAGGSYRGRGVGGVWARARREAADGRLPSTVRPDG